MKIRTLTLSPAVDIEYACDSVTADVSRARSWRMQAGGKGVNVARAVSYLLDSEGGTASVEAVIPVSGESGLLFRKLLDRESFAKIYLPADEPLRVNVTVNRNDGDPIEVNAPGALLGEARDVIGNTFLSGTAEQDILVLAGSIPRDTDPSFVASLCGAVRRKGAYAVCDADGELLKALVSLPKGLSPSLIKPNREELSRLTGRTLDDTASVTEAAASIIRSGGAEAVITTLSHEGAIFTDEAGSTYFPSGRVPAVRHKGAGDTFLGAFLYYTKIRGMKTEDAMRASATAAARYVSGESF